MGRGSTQLLIKRIVECLAKGPQSITSIAEETGFDRTAITNYLQALKESGLLVEEQQGTSKVFSVKSIFRRDTYFGLPLTPDQEKTFESLFYAIKKYWREQTSEKLLSTHAQKIAYDVIEKCKLKLPSGWYIYGGISVLSFDEHKEYSYTGLSADIEKCIKSVTSEHAKNKFAWQIKVQQYKKYQKEMYLLKEHILSLLYSKEFDSHPKNSLFVLIKMVRKLISLAPKDEREDYSEILESYQDLMLDIVDNLDDSQIIQRKRDIVMIFEMTWKYIALFNFKKDLSEFYAKTILDNHFLTDIKQQEDEIVELGSELQSLILHKEDQSKTALRGQLIEALAQMKSPSVEDVNKKKLEVEKKKKNMGEEAFQEDLLKKAGLK